LIVSEEISSKFLDFNKNFVFVVSVFTSDESFGIAGYPKGGIFVFESNRHFQLRHRRRGGNVPQEAERQSAKLAI
jgi:hypothetical protein